jgi:hypothetical protein
MRIIYREITCHDAVILKQKIVSSEEHFVMEY